MKKTFIPYRYALTFILFLAIHCFSSSVIAQSHKLTPVPLKLYETLGGYYEALPLDYASQPTKKYPLLIFLHGAGEKGTGSLSDLSRLLRNGPLKFINEKKFPANFNVNGEDFSFIVVAPQVTGSSGSNAAIGAMITHCLKTYRVDEQRIYITGLSLGGLMSYNYVGSKKEVADKIAASLLVCPNATSTEGRAQNIASSNLPVWLTNNDLDNLAKIANAIKTVDMINAYNPNPKAKISIFNKASHDAWTKTYDPTFKENGLSVYEWMLTYTTNRKAAAPVVVAAPPVANAGYNQIITLPNNNITLNASQSSAPAGNIASYSWSKLSGPSSATITNPAIAITTVSNLVQGQYQFQLKVTDNNASVSSDTVSITVKPQLLPPTANAGADTSITLPLDSIVLNGGNSKGISSAIKSYQWSWISGPASLVISQAAQEVISVKQLVAGTYVFALKVTDNNDYSSSDSILVMVRPEPIRYLTANAGIDQEITLPLRETTLDGSSSTPGTQHTIKMFQWEQISGPTNSGKITDAKNAVTKVTDLVPGSYAYLLRATDDGGNTATDTVKITVKYSPGILKADAGNDTTLILPAKNGLPLNGSNSTAPAGSNISCSWKRISGPGNAAAVLYPSVNLITRSGSSGLLPGVYTFQLTVRDDKRNQSTDIVVITVKESTVSARTAGALSNDEQVSSTIDESSASAPLDLNISPNPVVSGMKVAINGKAKGSGLLKIYDMQGRLLKYKSFIKDSETAVQQTMDVSSLPAGAYALQAEINGSLQSSSRFIKQ